MADDTIRNSLPAHIFGAPLDVMAAVTAGPGELPELDFVLPNLPAGHVGAITGDSPGQAAILALQFLAQTASGAGGLDIGRFREGPCVFLGCGYPEAELSRLVNAFARPLPPAEKERLARNLDVYPVVPTAPTFERPEAVLFLYRLALGRRLLAVASMGTSLRQPAALESLQAVAHDTGCAMLVTHLPLADHVITLESTVWEGSVEETGEEDGPSSILTFEVTRGFGELFPGRNLRRRRDGLFETSGRSQPGIPRHSQN
ncbi:MAG: helicase RepA family protein [Deltaproteobacteria bacterium]|jgi:hypothetical protein|nr:helicase RepA family protein [Deltaproteobacteria bacterium]